MTAALRRLPWTTVVPVLALVLLAFTFGRHVPVPVLVLVGASLIGAVLAAVHHAEVIAHKVGEPFGSLVLAVAVTVIEVGLIVTLMVSGGGHGGDTSELARDTVFAAVMISANGIVGLALLVSALKHHLAVFNPEGTGAALATVAALATLCLVLPRFTTSADGAEFSGAQLAFAAVASLALYVLFVFTQTVRHRDFFLPVDRDGRTRTGTRDHDADGTGDEQGEQGEQGEEHADPPTGRQTLASLGLLVVALVGVVGLAKVASPSIEDAVDAVGFPQAFVGVVIALLVLLPESIAATRNALRERVQVSLNLGYGSAMASIGLTIPTIAVASIWLDGPLALGLEPTQIVLLVVSVAVGTLTVVPGRAKPLQGGLHLALLAAFVFLSIRP
ncbi:Ca2+:H+ antiporter [Jatrophihabitans endophyticus]|uniref:Ca2+:H+ antiporter n=1 Tax=Jatrophihabitans endophyticus TaxID=1206085 RepID=A0A1M5EXT3_9ACTN|nr:ionic transporter y4hA [Jatrophihabitans endophyticus]SHF84049.1 Ca2+:H+ antiporter [Jatrophihabitans endophyticus]